MLISGKTDVTVYTWIYQNTNLAYQNMNVTFFVKKKIWYIRVFTIFCHCPSVQKWFSIFLWKLICCNINRRHIFLVLNLSLCNHNSGWMSCLISFIYGFSPSCEKWEAQSSKWKYVPPPGIEPATPCFPACRSNHLAIGTVNDRL